jgi:dTDP-4-amino-4,6-dideoxygalactose transaminase
MTGKHFVEDLGIFGGEVLFSTPKSTSNLLQPDIDKFLNYSKVFFEKRQYTNNGPNVKLLEERLAAFHQVKYCVTFSSGFWALVLAIQALALQGKTEIIMPSLTYRRMTDMAAWLDLKPHFCEVDPDTLAMSAETVIPCINKNTAIILGVHPIVNCCEVEELIAVAKKKNIPILFDSVESVYESTSSGKIGGFGNAECFSLHACKLFNGFGGGYLTTNDEELALKLGSARSFGFVGVDCVGVEGGMNAKLNEMHAAMSLASLDDVESQVARNRARYHTYRSSLSTVSGIRLLEFNEKFKTGYKNIVVEILDDWPLSRDETISILNADNVLARPYYYPPLHSKPMEYGYIPANLPVTDNLAESYLNLPCGQLVSNDEIVEIVELMRFISANARAIKESLSEVGST